MVDLLYQRFPEEKLEIEDRIDRAMQAAQNASDAAAAGPLHIDVEDKADLVKASDTHCFLQYS